MNLRTFFRKHPSLQGKDELFSDGEVPTSVFHMKDIDETQTDNQLIREALEKVSKNGWSGNDDFNLALYMIEKELGLKK